MIFNEINFTELYSILINEKKKIIIPCYLKNSHYLENKLTSLIVFDIEDNKYNSFNISHPDLELKHSENILESIVPKNCFIYDYKYFDRYWNNLSVFDLELNYWLQHNKTLTVKSVFESFFCYRNNINFIGELIPFTIHFFYCELIVKTYLDFVKCIKLDHITKYEQLCREVYNLERNGLKIDLNVTEEFKLPFNKDTIHTNYNLCTSTGRPSNTFESFNLAALNKTTGIKKSIIPKNDYLVEFDFDSSHLRLLGNLLNYKFNTDSVHKYLSELYTNKTNVSEEEYMLSKQLTFHQLYSNEEVFDIEFFKKVREFRKKLFLFYQKYDLLYLKSKREIKNIENATESKILNYYIQAYETEFCFFKIKKLNSFLSQKKTKLILWVYDSFLFDFSKEDNIKLLIDIKNILEEDDMKTHIKMGKNYHELFDITKKLNNV